MKRIIHINTTVKTGSTGKIAWGICALAEEQGCTCEIVYGGRGESGEIARATQSSFGYYCNNILARLFAMEGQTNFFSTKRLIGHLKKDPPDILHLHNLHGHYLHAGALFRYIKKARIPVVWTLHDCWAFTGGCAHFAGIGCEGWKTGCGNCKQCAAYPIQSRIDRTRTMLRRKKKWFSGVENLTIVTPSRWLADLVQQSYLKEYPVRVIHNGIDLDVFQPRNSSFRMQYGLENKKIILGVSFGWSENKGLGVFAALAKVLPEEYQIVLVGVDAVVQARLPENIITIARTNSPKELAEIYSAADLFVNPTREEVLGLVNIEANACGTPVLTFRSGGCPECISPESGEVVDKDDISALEREINRICTEKPFTAEACVENARRFDQRERYRDYLELYEERYDTAAAN